MVRPFSSTDTATAKKKSCFIALERSNFHMIDNLSIAVHTFAVHMLTLLSVDEILLPKYVNRPTNFRSLSLKLVMAPSYLKHVIFVLFALMLAAITFFCLLQAMQQEFNLGRWIFEKRLIINVVCVYLSFSRISSALVFFF